MPAIAKSNSLLLNKAVSSMAYWPLIAGMLALFIPTFLGLANSLWNSEAYAHGPLILGLSLWLLTRQWTRMPSGGAGPLAASTGWLIFPFGLLLYIVGRSQGLAMFELASFVILLCATLLILRGGAALRKQWFPLFFMLFMIPLPGTVINFLTLPMKEAVSYITELLLFHAGYPITRSGVILQIGQYELLVADACAGLQTLLTLEALGLFYLNVVEGKSAARNAVLGLLIVPISFAANVTRVIVLTLITYYFGDAAGQGFLHGFAGILLFLTALLMIVCVDWLIRRLLEKSVPEGAAREEKIA